MVVGIHMHMSTRAECFLVPVTQNLPLNNDLRCDHELDRINGEQSFEVHFVTERCGIHQTDILIRVLRCTLVVAHPR